MKKLFQDNRFIIISFIIWLATILIVSWISPGILPIRTGYFGPIPWANFDGVHYLKIASEGYYQYAEAFFPFYPLVVSFVFLLIPIPLALVGMVVSNVSFIIGLIIFYFLVLKEKNKQTAIWSIIFLLCFPASFFFGAVYTEGLFFLLTVAAMSSVRNNEWILAGILGALASATRLVGVFLFVFMLIEFLQTRSKKEKWKPIIGMMLVPVGLVAFMGFLWLHIGDPLGFIHVQSMFGANRSDAPIILLPQVVWRYIKIIFTAYMQPTPISYIVSIAELVVTAIAFCLLWIYRKSIRLSYIVYSLCVLIVPTLTGTLSSMTRYSLAAFPLFIMLGTVHNTKTKLVIAVFGAIFEIIACGLFISGWFIG
jgi:hypothetical protein